MCTSSNRGSFAFTKCGCSKQGQPQASQTPNAHTTAHLKELSLTAMQIHFSAGAFHCIAVLYMCTLLSTSLVGAQQQTLFGALSNFDAVNNCACGGDAHGFEIELTVSRVLLAVCSVCVAPHAHARVHVHNIRTLVLVCMRAGSYRNRRHLSESL